MPGTASFVAHHQRYDEWFDRHAATYASELLALRSIVPLEGRGLEIGVGTARFAAPLGVRYGVDPALPILMHAARRDVSVAAGVAEALPFRDGSFDYVLIVTTICFVDSPHAMLDEARRVLRPGGTLVLGFIDRTSVIGRHYEAHGEESTFYHDATFYSAVEVEDMLRGAGFTIGGWTQTLCGASPAMQEIEPVRPGAGQGHSSSSTRPRASYRCGQPAASQTPPPIRPAPAAGPRPRSVCRPPTGGTPSALHGPASAKGCRASWKPPTRVPSVRIGSSPGLWNRRGHRGLNYFAPS